jgi:hypothetical protein
MRRSVTTASVLTLAMSIAATGTLPASASSQTATREYATRSAAYLAGLISPVIKGRNSSGGSSSSGGSVPAANQSNVAASGYSIESHNTAFAMESCGNLVK